MRPPSRDRPQSLVGLRWAIGLVLTAALLAFLVRGADEPADPYLAPPATATGSSPTVPDVVRTPLPPFGETRITVRKADGGLVAWCLLLADTEQQRARGLMQVTDLGGYDGMLFRYRTDVTGPYYMRNTPTPLSIAFIDVAGHLVSQTDMAPCEDRLGCINYPATGPYRIAIEVPQGNLDRLGIAAGATITDDLHGC